ncbi:MAG: T9SS type A sorting domain-containing protein [Bacteroidales bacterium]|nr:T9SS type A sorting domain-containing protein [Bacteroidales bacterium]
MKTFYLFIAVSLLSISLFAQNNALDFDGTNDYVVLPNNLYSTNLQGGTEITIEYWFKGTELQSTIRFQNGGNYIVAGWSNPPKFIISSDESTNGVEIGGNVEDGNWHHIACVWKSNTTNGFRTYVDGVLSDQRNSANVTLPNISSGAWLASWGGTESLSGALDEVRIWKVARTETEIRQNMYRELPNPTGEANLVAYYKFNETSGTTLADSKGSYIGTLTNMTGTEWETSSAMFGPKKGLDFDGSNDYVFSNINSSYSTTLTAEVFIKFKSLTNQQNYIHINDGGINRRFVPYKDANNHINLFIADGSNNADVLSSDFIVEQDKWYHLTFVYENQEAYIYINGKLEAQKTMSYPYYLDGTDRLYLAADFGTGLPSNVVMDEFRLWNTARTVSEIRENMFKNITGNESGLIAYYNFDNNSDSTLQDFSGNGNDGILTNMDNSDWVSSSAFNIRLNTSSSSWTTTSNWSLGSAPVSTDNVGIFDWSATAPTISGSPSMQNMYIGSNASPTVNSNFSVSGNLIIQSNLALGNYIADLGSTGQLIEAGGLLCACDGHSDFCASLNNISCSNIGGLGATISCSANMGSTTVKRYHYPIVGAGGDQSIKRFYVIDPSNNSNLDATLVFHYDDSELNGNNENSLTLYKSEDQGQSWLPVGGVLNTSDNTITLSGISDFSWWTAAESGKILPVSLVKFEGTYQGAAVELEWSTASEINSNNFVVQKSENGVDFKDLQTLSAAGNSNQIINYRITDSEVKNGQIYYYQLIENDFDGTTQKLGIISVQCNGQSGFEVIEKIYPNPVNDLLYFQLNGNFSGTIILKNSLGEILQKIEVKEGVELQCVDMNQYPSGLYYLEVISFDKKQIVKFIK